MGQNWIMATFSKPLRRLLRGARAGQALVQARATGRRAPLLVGWCLTAACNRACVYCGRKDGVTRELDPARAVEAAREMAEAGVLRVSLTGGEPLLHPRVDDLARVLATHEVRVSLNSNGALLPDALPHIGVNLSGITISLDGAEATHDGLRGAGSFRDAVRGAEAARTWGIPLALHAVLGRQNLDQVETILGLARRLKAKVGFTPLEHVPTPADLDLKVMLPTPERWRAVVDDLIRRKRAGETLIQNSTAGLRYLRAWPQWRPIRCSAGLIYVRIQPDGALFGCGNLTGNPGAPSLASVSFGEAFAAMPGGTCQACWCDTRVEMNLALSGSPSALAAALRR
jgi:MoaA/NifB/PqqE/SkfB family radical SAM enzyme